MSTCETIKERLSAYLDGELTQQESQRIGVHIADCPTCGELLDDFRRMRADLKQLTWPEADDDQWSSVMAGLATKSTRGVGWLLWGGGLAVLAGYAAYQFVRDFTFASVERVGVLALILGAVLLFVSVLIERINKYPTDKYKDIEK